MNYETALALKEAGFPKKGFVVRTADDSAVRKGSVLEGQENAPTLPELIEACGRVNDEGAKFVLWFDGTIWQAGYYTYGDDIYIDDYPHPKQDGATPIEAVSNLYLSLHGKKD